VSRYTGGYKRKNAGEGFAKAVLKLYESWRGKKNDKNNRLFLLGMMRSIVEFGLLFVWNVHCI
jgi:hypothetical protein